MASGKQSRPGMAHTGVGKTGSHPMEVPGMSTGQGGTRNPNRVSSSAGTRPTSEPNPTNPYQTPTVPMGNGGADVNAAPGMPPSGMSPGAAGQSAQPVVGGDNSAPNNPGARVLGSTVAGRL